MGVKKAAKVCGTGRRHRPSDGCRSASCPRRWLYISSLGFLFNFFFFFFEFWFGPLTPEPCPPPPPTHPLPLLYAVMKADVGLFLLCASVSLTPLPHLTTFQRQEQQEVVEEGEEEEKNLMQYMRQKVSKWITLKKKILQCFCCSLFLFFHCQIRNGALYFDWVNVHMQSILEGGPGGDAERPAWVESFILFLFFFM